MEKKKPKKQINIYEMAGKAGKVVKKAGEIVLGVGIGAVLTKGKDLLYNKTKKS